MLVQVESRIFISYGHALMNDLKQRVSISGFKHRFTCILKTLLAAG